MKLFKIFLFATFFLVLFFSTYSLINFSINQVRPTSTKNDFYLQLEHGLKTAQLDVLKTEIRDYQNQYELYIMDDNNPVKIIFSTQKNPYWQISSLQEILKTAKINKQSLQTVDLSVNNPYATFKNN